MRIGFNPHKDEILTQSKYNHQVIIPVYIPNFDGYFAQSFDILKWCLSSIFTTSHANTFITIVNNGSCQEVAVFLTDLFQKNQIHELIHTTNIGKINAISKAISGHNFDFVTVSDSDVLFLNDWQSQTYTVFSNFKKAGIVGLVPSIDLDFHFTSNLLFDYFFSSKITFSDIQNKKALQRFYTSIGRNATFLDNKTLKNLQIHDTNGSAGIGSAHFVATYRGFLFDKMANFSPYKMGALSETYLDEIAFGKGFWRLTTLDNFAYHLGNVAEDWMLSELDSLTLNNQMPISLCLPKTVSFFQKLKSNLIFERILTSSFSKKWFQSKINI